MSGGLRRAQLLIMLTAALVVNVAVFEQAHSSDTMSNAVTMHALAANPTNSNCTLLVPAHPLTAEGLATPYQLTATNSGSGACHEANSSQSAFVQAVILDPATGAITVYNPLVIDRNSTPAMKPIVPHLPAGAVVGIWFGFDGDRLTLADGASGSLTDGQCVNGSRGSRFGQFAYCNAPAFFSAANRAVQAGKLRVPSLGTAADGKPCPTVRDFFIVDQDQSDNLPMSYLADASGNTAQNNAANSASMSGADVLGNPSDNGLLDKYVAPALRCSVWTASDASNPGHKAPALALNELQARSEQGTPVALVPAGDPMALVNGSENRGKVNLYRVGVDQPQANSDYYTDTARYCRQLLRVFPQRLMQNSRALKGTGSPSSDAADSLYTFLGQRFVGTYRMLDCESRTGQPDPVSVSVNGSGVATGVNVDTTGLKASLAKLQPYLAGDDAADSQRRDDQAFE